MRVTCQYQKHAGMKQLKSGRIRRRWTTLGKDSLSRRIPKGPLCLYNLPSMTTFNGWKRIAGLGTLISHALLAGCILLNAPSASAQESKTTAELTVAAAADLSTALKEIGDLYEKKTGIKVKLSFGASGALTQQIQNAAPFDLFFSADIAYPQKLGEAGLCACAHETNLAADLPCGGGRAEDAERGDAVGQRCEAG